METTFVLIDLAIPFIGLVALWTYSRVRAPREITIHVDRTCRPETIPVRQGEPLRLRLVRAIHSRCTDEIVFPSLNLRRALPVGEPLTIDLRPQEPGLLEFFCGMHMLRGALEVRPQI